RDPATPAPGGRPLLRPAGPASPAARPGAAPRPWASAPPAPRRPTIRAHAAAAGPARASARRAAGRRYRPRRRAGPAAAVRPAGPRGCCRARVRRGRRIAAPPRPAACACPAACRSATGRTRTAAPPARWAMAATTPAGGAGWRAGGSKRDPQRKVQAQVALALPVCQVQEQGAGRRAHPRAEAVAHVHAHLAERLGRVAGIDEGGHAPGFVEIVVVLDAGHRQRGRADHGVVLVEADALVAIAANGPRPPGAEAEVIGHAGLRVGPHPPDFAAYRQHVALAHRPPLLAAQARAEIGLAGVEHDAHAAPDRDQVAFAGIVFVVDVAAQPFRGQRGGGQVVFVAAVDLDVIVRQQHAPAVLVFDPAVARALALAQTRGAQREAPHVQPLDVGMVGQHADGILLALLVRRQIQVGVGALAQAVDADPALERHGMAEYDVLAVGDLGPHPGLVVHP